MYFEQIPAQFTLFFAFYGGTAMVALLASIYLCLRKVNVFAPSVTPPRTLSCWTATFFAFMFLAHVWWLLFYIFSGEIYSVSCVVIAVLDSVALLTTLPGMLFAMLQDRRRTVWPVVLLTIPYAILAMLHLIYPNGCFVDLAIWYILTVYVLFSVYMVFAVRQYGRWLRDNYVDLEHKEVWVSHILVIVVLIIIILDGFEYQDIIISSIVQLIELTFIGFLLWRVETLPLLENTPTEQRSQQSLTISSNIEQLLIEHCVDTKLYLQHDLTLLQLAQAIGTNRLYLSQYFSRQGITYNAYINDLRINYFMSLYHEKTAAGEPIVAQQLASASGYRSYSTFSLAFKQRTGQSVTAWLRAQPVD
jgi:AraC-like DNA-binding protein